MRVFVDLLRRFQSDERGVFAVIFGLMAIVLVAFAGATVDYTSVETARTRAQLALDSAALGLQPTIYTSGVTPSTIQPQAQALVNERLANDVIAVTMETPVIDKDQGTLRLEASVTVPTAFIQLIGLKTMSAHIMSEATRKQLNLEVAMVLDNSGSMASNSRMTNLKSAANCAVNVLLNGDCSSTATTTTSDNTRIAIIPFTEFVNVGTANKTKPWMDQTGASAVARDGLDDNNYDGDAVSTNINRFTLFTNMGVAWEGCVQARNHVQDSNGDYYDTADIEPNISVPDSLFAPAFAPDQPDTAYFDQKVNNSYLFNNYLKDSPTVTSTCPSAPRYVWTQVKTKCNQAASNSSTYTGATCTGGTTTDTYQQYSETGAVTTVTSTRPSSIFNNPDPGASAYTDAYSSTSSAGKYNNTRVRTWIYQFSDRELQERICKYVSGNTLSSLTNGPGGRTGPNADCPAAAIQPLTNVKKSVTDRITLMSAVGGTNIHQGVMWGFHALSPTEPLPEAKPYDPGTTKAMIVMTDGENTHAYTSGDFAHARWFVAYNYPYVGRLTATSTAALQTEMDNRTKATCANAKAKGITIYTIGLSAPNQTTIDMLKACATDSTKAFFPTQSSELTSVFKQIADQLATLRLAK